MYLAALDPASGFASLAVLKDNELLCRVATPMHGRDGAALPVFVLGELKKLGLELHDISRWSVGSGPGSFTGLRLAAALVAGWRFQQPDVHSRCVPGACALAAALDNVVVGETVGCLYDGRNREVLYYRVRRTAAGWEFPGDVAVLDREGAERFFDGRSAEKLAVFAGEAGAVLPVLPSGLEVAEIAELHTEALALNPLPEYDDDLTRLVYIRPAVYPKA